jgi:hypothetical protein
LIFLIEAGSGSLMIDRDALNLCKLRAEAIKNIQFEKGPDSPLLIEWLVEVATSCEADIGRLAASKLLAQALSLSKKTWGVSHPITQAVLSDQVLAISSKDPDRFSDFWDKSRAEAIAMERIIYAGAPLVLLDASLRIIPNVTRQDPSCTEFANENCARKILSALTRAREAWGEFSPFVAILRTQLAIEVGSVSSHRMAPINDKKRYAFVVEQCKKAIYDMTATLGDAHPDVGQIAKECGIWGQTRRLLDDAETMLKTARKIFAKNFGANDSAVRGIDEELSRVLYLRELKL